MFKSSRSILALLLAVGCVGTGSADRIRFNAGLWETTIEVENPYVKIPPQSRQECVQISEFDLDQVLKDVEQQGCKVLEQRLSGSTLNWRVECQMPDGGAASGEGSVTVASESMQGNMTIHMNMGGMQLDTRTHWTGRRIGSC